VTAARGSMRWTEARLLIAPAAMTVVGLLAIVLAPRGRVEWGWNDLSVGIAFGVAAFVISFVLSAARYPGDQTILPITITLSALGLLMIQRLGPSLAAADPNYAGLPRRQLIYLAAGLALMLATALVMRRRLHLLHRFRYTALGASLALLALTLVIGTEINGARLWITIGPVQYQPSELVKVTLVIFLASYLDERRDVMRGSWRIGPLTLPPLPTLAPLGLTWGACVAILVLANDLGASLLLFSIFLTMLYLSTGRGVYVIVGLGSFALAAVAAYQRFSRVGIRVQNMLDPWRDPLDAGYQQIQSDYAIASGGVFGAGFALGEPWRIPIVETDFILSAVGEELGLLGAVALILLQLLLAARSMMIGMRARDGFTALLACGLSATLAIQTLIIAMGVVRIIPLTGITLPFVSYGGSSLLTNFIIAGMLLAISANARQPGEGVRRARRLD
jgi:cell division protein FtsW (lipid II flippase)